MTSDKGDLEKMSRPTANMVGRVECRTTLTTTNAKTKTQPQIVSVLSWCRQMCAGDKDSTISLIFWGINI